MATGSRRFGWAMVLGVAGAVALIGVGWRLPTYVSELTYAAEAGRAQAARAALAGNDNLSQAFKYVAKALRPSVVSIHSVIRIEPEQGQRRRDLDVPDDARRFFGDDFFDRFFDTPGPRGGFEQQGLGSGVVVSEDGYVVTNNHVVRGATELKVTFSDGRTLEAKTIGTDAKTDLAVLKVDATSLTPATFGDSETAEVGEWVLAIGTPFELQHTVTAGIISAKGRAGVGLTDYEDFLQTDAAINPGNSGGPLVNLRGEVIGINTAIASRTGGNLGVGFAIPSNMVKTVMDAIVRDGRVHRGQLGAMIQDMNEDLARSFNFDSTEGVLVGDVVKDGAADKAGIRNGDIITRFDGKPMTSANQLRNTVAATPPGKEVEIELYRDGAPTTVRARVGELSDQQELAAGRGGAEPSEALGMVVETLTPDLAQQLGYTDEIRGVVVTRVQPGSLASRLGLARGDVILSAGNSPLTTVAQFRAAVNEETLKNGVRLQIMRDGARRFLFLKTGR